MAGQRQVKASAIYLAHADICMSQASGELAIVHSHVLRAILPVATIEPTSPVRTVGVLHSAGSFGIGFSIWLRDLCRLFFAEKKPPEKDAFLDFSPPAVQLSKFFRVKPD